MTTSNEAAVSPGEVTEQQDLTFIVLALWALVLAAWEVWTILNRRDGDTVSATLRKLGTGQPFIPFMFGMLQRHLWGDTEAEKAYRAGWEGGEHWPLQDGQAKKNL